MSVKLRNTCGSGVTDDLYSCIKTLLGSMMAVRITRSFSSCIRSIAVTSGNSYRSNYQISFPFYYQHRQHLEHGKRKKQDNYRRYYSLQHIHCKCRKREKAVPRFLINSRFIRLIQQFCYYAASVDSHSQLSAY